MTREEVIITLKVVDENATCDDCLYYSQMEDCPNDEDCIIRQALDMAIKALEQEPNCPYYVIDDDGHGLCTNHRVLEQEPSGETVSLEAFKQVMWERDIAIGQLKELGYGFGQKIEHCDDAISRQAVLEIFGYVMSYWKEHAIDVEPHEIKDALIEQYEFTAKQLSELPSVKPQEPKTGHWIMPVQDDGMSDPIYYQVRCSKCGFDLDPQTWHMELHQYGADKFCPNCGAKMVEPQESEDTE